MHCTDSNLSAQTRRGSVKPELLRRLKRGRIDGRTGCMGSVYRNINEVCNGQDI